MAQQLSLAQLQTLWIQAGGPASAAPTAAAIAYAESSGYASNPNTASGLTSDPNATDPYATSAGLWQINTGNPASTSYGGQQALLDPLTNAKAAVAAYTAANGFGPWSTYTNGEYQQYLPSSLAAAGQNTIGTAVNAAAGVLSPTIAASQAVAAVTGGAVQGVAGNVAASAAGTGGIPAFVAWLQASALNVAIFVVGLVVLLGGLLLAASNSPTIVNATKTIGKTAGEAALA